VPGRSGAVAPTRPNAWLFAAFYALHLLDEGLVAGGLPAWSTQRGFHFTWANWLSVNALSFGLVITAVALVARERWPSWVLVSLAVHIALHALMHLGATAWGQALSPGAVTGTLLGLPLVVCTLRWGGRELERPVMIRAVLIGAASFQAPWDLLVRLVFGLPFWVEAQELAARSGILVA